MECTHLIKCYVITHISLYSYGVCVIHILKEVHIPIGVTF